MRADFRREQPFAAAGAREVDRLDADAIANQVQHRPAGIARVVDADGEHAVEPLDAVDAPLLVGVQQHLGVGVIGLPLVLAERLQLAAQLGVVVDFAVERDRRPLPSRFDIGCAAASDRSMIDSRRCPSAQWRSRERPQAGAVRTTMRHAIAHPRDDVRTGSPIARDESYRRCRTW